MNRRNFLSVTGSLTGGALLLPQFLNALGGQNEIAQAQESVVFIQLNGGNDGLNTYVPYTDPLYYKFRQNIALKKQDLIGKNKGMAFHPALKDLAKIQEDGQLTIIQNVGYPIPSRSHFRSQEIWQTGSSANEYLSDGWLGRYLDLQYDEHLATGGIHLGAVDNLALKGRIPNSITVKNPDRLKTKSNQSRSTKLTNNPQLDFVRQISDSISEGSHAIHEALRKSKKTNGYPASGLSRNLSWISRLIKGQLNTKIYYTSLTGFDTHDHQLYKHDRLLQELNDALFAFYGDLKQSGLLSQVTIVIFSEFGRRVADNGKGTDHGTAAPMFVIGGKNKGKVIGDNPDLINLDNGDLIYKIDFRSVYAAILQQKLRMDPKRIGIQQKSLRLF